VKDEEKEQNRVTGLIKKIDPEYHINNHQKT